MSENESTKAPVSAAKKSGASCPKRIRIIGGPTIKPPPDADFQQVPFTLQGLSEIVGLEYADTIVYWPSPELFIREHVAEELSMLVKMIIIGNVHSLFGFRVKRSFITGVDMTKDVVRHKDHIVLGPSFDAKLDKDRPPQGYRFAISLTPPAGHPNALASLKSLLENHIMFTWLHEADMKNGNWSGYGEYCGACDPAFAAYAESSGLAAPEKFIENILTTVLGEAFPAIYRGATVAVIVPSGFITSDGSWSSLPVLRHAYSWLSPLIHCRSVSDIDDINVGVKNTTSEDTTFIRHLRNWRKLDCDSRAVFAVARHNSDGSTDMVGEGIFRPTELKSAAVHHFPFVHSSEADPGTSPNPFASDVEAPPAFRVEPLSSTPRGDALGLAFMYGTGGLVLMNVPRSLETLLGIQTTAIPFKKIELTGRRIPISGQSENGYIAVTTLLTDEKYDVPMAIDTFRRLLAFCVAAKAAEKTHTSGGIDVTTMKIGTHDLSAVVDRFTHDTRDKPGQIIKEAFEKALPPGVKCKYIQPVVSGINKSTRRLHPNLWSIVDFNVLMAQSRKPKKNEPEDVAALRTIFSALD